MHFLSLTAGNTDVISVQQNFFMAKMNIVEGTRKASSVTWSAQELSNLPKKTH